MPPMIRLIPVEHDPFATPVVFGGQKGATNVAPLEGVRQPGGTVQQAQELVRKGADAQTVFHSTGWYRGPDGEWKWIIPDQGASLNKNLFTDFGPPSGMVLKTREQPYKLGDILNHPDLYAAYPNLKDINIRNITTDDLRNNVGGQYNPSTNTIAIRPEDERGLIATLLHEVQHNIQHTEGFGRGGNVEMFSGEANPRDLYNRLAGEVESRQVENQYLFDENRNQLPTAMPRFPKPEAQIVYREGSSKYSPGTQYQFVPVEHDPFAAPTLQAPMQLPGQALPTSF